MGNTLDLRKSKKQSSLDKEKVAKKPEKKSLVFDGRIEKKPNDTKFSELETAKFSKFIHEKNVSGKNNIDFASNGKGNISEGNSVKFEEQRVSISKIAQLEDGSKPNSEKNYTETNLLERNPNIDLAVSQSDIVACKPKRRTRFFDLSFRTILGIFSIIFTLVFFTSGVVGAVRFSGWFKDVMKPYESTEKSDPNILIPEFLLDENGEKKEFELDQIFKFETDFEILRFEKVRNSAESGLGASPTTTYNRFYSVLDGLEEQGRQVYSFEYFLRSLYFKEHMPEGSLALIFVGGYAEHLGLAKDLKKRGYEATFFLPAGKIGDDGYLSWEDVDEIKEMGHEIGVTGFSYVRLGSLSTAEQRDEIFKSKRLISQKIGEEPLYFYYSNGSYNTDTLTFLKYEGFAAGISSNESSKQKLERSFELSSTGV